MLGGAGVENMSLDSRQKFVLIRKKSVLLTERVDSEGRIRR